MIKSKPVVVKKSPESRPSYVETNYSPEALRLLYEAMGLRMPTPAAPAATPGKPAAPRIGSESAEGAK